MKGITDYLEKEQVDQILGAAKTCSIRDYLMLRILWRAGCRVSELLSITASDIELKNQREHHESERRETAEGVTL